jgi:hypothetical protein
MTHPLASALAPLMDCDVGQLHALVAQWVVVEPDPDERARYRAFGSELRAMQRRIQARAKPPTQEEIEIALSALLVLAGRRAGIGPMRPSPPQP